VVIASAALVVFVSACSGETDPATDISGTSAVLNGKVSCDAGQSGAVWWKYRDDREASLPGAGWRYVTSQPYACYVDVPPTPISTTITGLTPGSPYSFELCTSVGNNLPPTIFCWDKNGNAHDNSVAGDDDHFTTAAYDPAADPGQAWTTSPEDPDPDGISLPRESGAGTDYYCGWIPKSYVTVDSVGLKAFKGSMGPTHMCWGTGHNRGTYKNVDQPLTQGEVSAWGEYTGWRYDGVVAAKGPYTENGKEKWMRLLQFHACEPPKGPCTVTTRTYQIQFNNTVWVDQNNVAHAIRKHTP
jgi:hypothetical protein